MALYYVVVACVVRRDVARAAATIKSSVAGHKAGKALTTRCAVEATAPAKEACLRLIAT